MKLDFGQTFYFSGLQRSANYKILYLNTKNSFMKPSQISDLKVFKIILATAVLLYTLSIFRGSMFVLLEEKKLKHEKYAMSKSAIISSTYMLGKKIFNTKQST